jgi:hypothetical protein
MCKFWQKLWDWFLFAEKENEERFEKKYKKILNLIRVIVIISMVFVFSWLNDLINLKNLSAPVAAWRYAVFLVILYILIVLYKAWIKDCWEFFKKDSIVHYIFLAVIPVAIVFLGYQYVFKSSVNNPTPDKDKKVQTVRTLKNDYDEIIDRLNGFYAVLFTAIAVIAAILAFGAWRTIKELKEKLESYKKIENDVEFLKKKKDLAEWVQNKFEKDVNKRILTSISFDLNEEEEKKLKEIKRQIQKEIIDDSWLKLVYAKQWLEEKQKNKPSKEDDFIKIENIFDYIEKMDLLKENPEIPQLLSHLRALMYWFWYENKKSVFLREHNNEDNIPWVDQWWKEDEGGNENEGGRKGGYKRIQLVEKAVEYYKQTLDLYKKNEEDNVDETLGNLGVVLIQLSKFKDKEDEKKKCLENALEYLEKVKEKSFNTHWDKARVLYYLDPKKNKKEIDKLMAKVKRKIVNDDDKAFFEDSIENEQKEIGLDGKRGFPGEIEFGTKDKKEKKRFKKFLSKLKFWSKTR